MLNGCILAQTQYAGHMQDEAPQNETIKLFDNYGGLICGGFMKHPRTSLSNVDNQRKGAELTDSIEDNWMKDHPPPSNRDVDLRSV